MLRPTFAARQGIIFQRNWRVSHIQVNFRISSTGCLSHVDFENKTRKSRGYAKNPSDTAVYRGWRFSGSLFREHIKLVFRCRLGEQVYQISGL